MRLSGLPSYSEAMKQPQCQAEPGCQSPEAFERISCPWCARADCMEICCIIPLRLCIWQSIPRYLGVACEYGTLDSSGDDFVRECMLGSTMVSGFTSVLGFGRISHNFYVHVDSDPVLSPFGLNGELCSADASARCPSVRCSHLELWKLFSWHPRG